MYRTLRSIVVHPRSSDMCKAYCISA